MKLMSDDAFRIALSLVTGGVAGLWAIHDFIFIARLRGRNWRDPLITDQLFGYVIGIIIGVVGVLGTLRFNDVI